MSEQVDKKRGGLPGGLAGLALGAWVGSILLLLTSSSIFLLLLAAPLALGYLGMIVGEKVSFFARRRSVVLGVAAVVLIAGVFVPERVQAYRFQQIVDTLLPIYPGAELKEMHSDEISGHRTPGFVLLYGTEDSPQQIMEYMRPEMIRLGWTELEPLQSDVGPLYRYRRPGLMVHIYMDYTKFEFTVACAAFNLYHRYVPTTLETIPLEEL